MLKKADWIWLDKDWAADEYAEFYAEFEGKTAMLEIAAENNYAAYVNGELAAFGQYPGYPNHKYADSVDITPFLNGGKNKLEIVVWYYGLNTSVNIDDGAGVIFDVVSGGNVIVASGKDTLSRIDARYKNGYKKLVTVQLGYSFKYDPTAKLAEYKPSRTVEKCRNISPRPVKKLVMTEQPKANLIKSGNGSYLFDLGLEVAGQLKLDIFSEEKQELLIAYGEHIDDGNVRRFISGRDFSVEYVAPKGQSAYINPFRRLGCRYLEVFAEKPVTFNEITVIPTEYPKEILPFKADSELRQKIYDTAVRTLLLCKHEHYEDCPWREQALYTFDGRNEMLFDYYATGDYEYARANLLLISQGVMKDGFLELTYPAVNTPAIPMFSLSYILQIYEYVKFSGDRTLLGEVLPVAEKIMKAFDEKAKHGLIADFKSPFWNFYEWTDGSDNSDFVWGGREYEERFSLILNCYYVLAGEKFAALLGKPADFSEYKKKIKETFYDEKKGLFRAYAGENFYTVFGNSLAVLIGIGDETTVKNMLLSKDIVPVTLSAAMYFYEALLCFGDKYKDYILNKLDKDYGYMLENGATSFWETIEGAGSFDAAGSLCHGWSALPVYFYHIFNEKK